MTDDRIAALKSATFSAPDVPSLARELHVRLQRYIEAQYPIRHATVVAERHALLESADVISREPFIESMPGYLRGRDYGEIALPQGMAPALAELAHMPDSIPAHLYQHQTEALEAFLHDDRDLIVVSGTGSGKTETFLLPILVRSIEEARNRQQSFQLPGMRTLLLYPMNALVNDQLTRLRRMFGNQHLLTWFRQRYHVSRPVRFGMYTSRTPYAGMMSTEKNRQKLLPLLEYYLQLEAEQAEQTREFKALGRWPALDLRALRSATLAGKALISDHDSELYTRQQMQHWCPDMLITNYAMLEYMLMRPIERSIFQQTAEWLAQDAANTLLIVLDEAHLYSGVTGAEMSLLLRRLQARLGITRNRVRYILTSASLATGNAGQAAMLDFANTLVGSRSQSGSSFAVIQGQRVEAPLSPQGQAIPRGVETKALCDFDLQGFTLRATKPHSGLKAIGSLAENLNWPTPISCADLPSYLGQHLPHLHSFQQLWQITSATAVAFHSLALQLFPLLDEQARGKAASGLLALSAAAKTPDDLSLLPVRAHLFFRGLPPLYACINPGCSARRVTGAAAGPAEIGALWLSPRLHCTCGARVYELYAHRHCGAIFLRTFAATEPADFYWHEPGERGNDEGSNDAETLLLIGQPHPKSSHAQPIYMHITTGRIFTGKRGVGYQAGMEEEQEEITVYRPAGTSASRRAKKQQEEGEDEESELGARQWKACPVCRKRLGSRSISSLATKGEQPFVNLVRRQFELQPPTTPEQDAAPNMGRKVLLFSDGRQRAARLARDLPREVELDTFRQALLLAVARRGRRIEQPLVRIDGALYREFVAVCAQYRLYFFDGISQATLLRQIRELREDYEIDVTCAEDDGWEPPLPEGYHQALLRQVVDPFYSMQRMCAAVVEPAPNCLQHLKKKPIFAQLAAADLRALIVAWIDALLAKGAFDSSIAPAERKNTLPYEEGAAMTGTGTWNEAEKAAETLLGYTKSTLLLIRTTLTDELCEVKEGNVFLKPEKLALRLTLNEAWYQCSDCAQLIWLPLRGSCPNPRCGSVKLVQLPGDDPSLRARTDFYREPIRQVVEESHSPMHLTAEEHTAQLSYRDTQQIAATTEQYELRFQDIGISDEHPAIDILSCTTTMEVGVDIGALLGIGLRTMPPRRANYQQRAGRAGRRGSALSTVLSYSENGSHDAHYFEHPDEMIAGVLPCPQISRVNQRLVRRHIQAALIQTFFLEQVDMAGKLSERHYGYLSEALGTAQSFFTSSSSSGFTGFEKWLSKMMSGHTPLLKQSIAAWLPDTLAESVMNEHHKRDFVQSVANDFTADLRRLGDQMFPQATALKKDTDQFGLSAEETSLLDVLFEHGFLPTYAFPREVRSFVIEEWKHGNNGKWRIGIKQRPEQSIDIALSEYVPGRELIVDKVTYSSGGIYVAPFPGATLATRVPSVFKHARNTFALCFNCGYTHHEQAAARSETPNDQCPLCRSPLKVEEVLDPPGFAPEKAKPRQQGLAQSNSLLPNGTVTQVKLVLPLTDKDDFAYRAANGRVAWSYAEHRELLIANCGVDRTGFSICRSCGAAATGKPLWLQQAHERPFLVPSWVGTPKCNSSDGIWHGYLGHTFHSDLLLLRFLWPTGVAYEVGQFWMRDAFDTLAQALLIAATRLLDVATTELQAGWSYTVAASGIATAQASLPRMADFFLFDTLSGGAGYATQVGPSIEPLLLQAQHILDTCPEDCERSCYRCLRAYSNRLLHPRLDRRLASTLLQAIVSGKSPAELPISQQAAQLKMLRQFLELASDVECQPEGMLHGIPVPLLVKTAHEYFAIGTYPVQQDRQVVKHSLDALPVKQVRLFSDYELVHNLPTIARSLL